MSNFQDSLAKLMELDGSIVVALVDSKSGMVLGSLGNGVDVELAAAGNTEVVRAKIKTIKSLKLNDEIEDILISLNKQYHLIRPVVDHEGLFFYLVLDRARANLALARRALLNIEVALEL